MWAVWCAGYPDPSRPVLAKHYDDPAKDRSGGSKRIAVFEIAFDHRGLSVNHLASMEQYALPKDWRTTIGLEPTKEVEAPAPKIEETKA